MTAHPVRSSTQKVCDLPDAGPWETTLFRGVLFMASQISGVWYLDGKEVKRAEYIDHRPMFTGDL